MAVTKRKRDGSIQPLTTSRFMLLPLEIRLKIYEYCYSPQPKGRGYPQPCVSSNLKVRRIKPASGSLRERSFFENSRCSRPFLHQSLLFTCRQAYIDVWPYYAACHSIGFTRPVKFANDILSFMPPPQLTQIKHLALRVGQEPTSCSPASRVAVRGMVSDVQRLFDHYPDVFYNLESFTWELSDKRTYCPNRANNETAMYEVLLQNLANHHQRERLQWGLLEGDPLGEYAMKIKKWRLGLVARRVKLKIDDSGRQHEESSLVFFERLPTEHPRHDGGRKGLQYIDIASWMNEPMSAAPSVGGQQVHTLIMPEVVTWPVCQPKHTKRFCWFQGDIDWKSGTDILIHAALMDVGVDSSN